MNATLQAISSYGKNSTPLRTNRSIEYEVFAQITHQLKVYSAPDSFDFPALVGVLHANRSLWTTLAMDVADSENGLSNTLKGQIFYLAEFVNQHTQKVLLELVSADVLTDINLAMMRGLEKVEMAK